MKLTTSERIIGQEGFKCSPVCSTKAMNMTKFPLPTPAPRTTRLGHSIWLGGMNGKRLRGKSRPGKAPQ